MQPPGQRPRQRRPIGHGSLSGQHTLHPSPRLPTHAGHVQTIRLGAPDFPTADPYRIFTEPFHPPIRGSEGCRWLWRASAPRAAAELAQDAPAPELGVGAFGWGAQPGEGAVSALLRSELFRPGRECGCARPVATQAWHEQVERLHFLRQPAYPFAETKVRALTRRRSQQPPREVLISSIRSCAAGHYFKHVVCKHILDSLKELRVAPGDPLVEEAAPLEGDNVRRWLTGSAPVDQAISRRGPGTGRDHRRICDRHSPGRGFRHGHCDPLGGLHRRASPGAPTAVMFSGDR